MLTVRTTEILVQAGWLHGRTWDIRPAQAHFASLGLRLLDSAKAFLTEFGGLSFPERDPTLPAFAEGCHFDPIRAAGPATYLFMADYERQLDRELSPIGAAERQHWLLMLDPDGRVFGAFEDIVLIFGNTPTDALNAICNGDDVPEFG